LSGVGLQADGGVNGAHGGNVYQGCEYKDADISKEVMTDPEKQGEGAGQDNPGARHKS
jgi:hypothetical protein